MIESSGDVLLGAADLTQVHGLGIWDALMLSAAADARCRLLLSEDLPDGFTWRGVTVTDPFKAERHPLLAALVSKGERPPRTRKSARRRGPP